MATEDGRTGPGLSEQLLEEPHRFNFFQAVRLLGLKAFGRAPDDPRRRRPPPGGDGPPDREAVRFRALPSLGFPAGAIAQVRQPRPRGVGPGPGEVPEPPPEMSVSFFGLFGPNGVLPYHYTALLIRRLRDKDHSLRDFLDLFNHRLTALFYRAWEKYRLPFVFERAEAEGAGRGNDPVTRSLYSLVGLGTAGLRGRLEVDDEAFLYYGGHFAHHPRSAVALGQILEDYFAMPIRVREAQGQWLHLEPEDQARLPGGGRPGGLNTCLGVDTVIGARVWDVQSKFRLRVGPLSYEQFRALMPDGHALRPLRQMTRSFAGPELDFDVQPVLEAAEVPWCRLGAAGGGGPRLGWNTWVRNRPFADDVDGPTFSAGSRIGDD